MTSSHQNQSQRRKHGHDQEPLGATPHIHDLGQRDVNRRAHGGSDDIDDIEQGVGLEFGGDEGEEVAEDGGLEGVDEVEEPDAAGG